jgi:hypothetical protein
MEEEASAGLYSFAGNDPGSRADYLGLLVVYIGRGKSGMFEPGWDWYANLVLEKIDTVVGALNDFDGTDMYGEKCRMKVWNPIGYPTAPTLSDWKYVASPGAGYVSGPDYALLWSKFTGAQRTGAPFGFTPAGILGAKQPRCSLCWAGTYIPSWLARPDVGLGGEAWIHPEPQPTYTAKSANFIVAHIVNLINEYQCCKTDADGNSWVFRASSRDMIIDPPSEEFPKYRTYPYAYAGMYPCKGCPRVSTPFECRVK